MNRKGLLFGAVLLISSALYADKAYANETNDIISSDPTQKKEIDIEETSDFEIRGVSIVSDDTVEELFLRMIVRIQLSI